MTAAAKLEGQRFGRLTASSRTTNDARGRAVWMCVCDCGKTSTVITAALRNGNTKSCGCYFIERRNNAQIKHGNAKKGKKTRLYLIWNAMVSRCRYDHERNRNYHGRNIKVCDQWAAFESFLGWSKVSGYGPRLTLERKDNNKDYCPENCTWIPRALQQRNRRNVPLSKDGTPCFLLARKNGITYDIYRRRKDKLGWTPEEAATIPVGQHRQS